MNRDARTQPLAVEQLTSCESLREPATVAETVPTGSDYVWPGRTEVLRPEPAMTEAFVESARPSMAEQCAVAVSHDSTLVADQVQPKTDSEPLRQLDRLSALVEQELRKSNPAYVGASGKSAPPASPAAPISAEEESLQSYLDRFMERVTGKKPDAPPAPGPAIPAASPQVVAAPATDEAATPAVQAREPARAPECRQKLAAMRDVANESARCAVAVHAGRRQWGRTRQTLFAAVAASAVSSGLAVLHLATSMPGAIEGAVCAGILAMLMTGRFFLRCRRMVAPTVNA